MRQGQQRPLLVLQSSFNRNCYLERGCGNGSSGLLSDIGVNVPAVDYSNYLELAENDAKKLVNDAVADAKNESVNARGIVLRTVTSVAETIWKRLPMRKSICSLSEREA